MSHLHPLMLWSCHQFHHAAHDEIISLQTEFWVLRVKPNFWSLDCRCPKCIFFYNSFFEETCSWYNLRYLRLKQQICLWKLNFAIVLYSLAISFCRHEVFYFGSFDHKPDCKLLGRNFDSLKQRQYKHRPTLSKFSLYSVSQNITKVLVVRFLLIRDFTL